MFHVEHEKDKSTAYAVLLSGRKTMNLDGLRSYIVSCGICSAWIPRHRMFHVEHWYIKCLSAR